MARRYLIAGNWKMNGSRKSVEALLNALREGCTVSDQLEYAVFPPFVFLDQCQQQLADSDLAWGAQNVSAEPQGAYTGEVSASMLKEGGCRYVLVGHSERRTLYGESNQQVADKFAMALSAELLPVLCVGETLAQRKAGETLAVVQQQLAAVLTLVDNHRLLSPAVIAYEPVWAIGTGQHASPEQAQQVHAAIRQQVAKVNVEVAQMMRILYGGSVKPENAKGFFAQPDIDGALVGGASLDADKFIEIGQLCKH